MHTLVGILCVAVFLVAFLIGDIAGVVIEARISGRWRQAAEKTGFMFDGGRARCGEIDCIWIEENNLLLIRTDKSPDRFPDPVQLSVEIMSRLGENLPQNQRFSLTGDE